MTNIMMRLGEFKFSINTAAYQTLTRNTLYRWQAQERFGQLPAQQFTGLGEDSITLNGDIYPHYKGGLHQVDEMRKQAGLGKPLSMMDGHGLPRGKWVILSIEETGTIFLGNGVPRKISFALKITQYGDDK